MGKNINIFFWITLVFTLISLPTAPLLFITGIIILVPIILAIIGILYIYFFIKSAIRGDVKPVDIIFFAVTITFILFSLAGYAESAIWAQFNGL
jgi:hypothetical protein